MATLRKLSAMQLNKIINDTRAELTRRENIDAATIEIHTILKKYKIDVQDIDLGTIARTSGRRSIKKHTKAEKSRDRRRTVKAKYQDPNSSATWTGRGRTPGWVQRICKDEGINVEGFKKDARFRR